MGVASAANVKEEEEEGNVERHPVPNKKQQSSFLKAS